MTMPLSLLSVVRGRLTIGCWRWESCSNWPIASSNFDRCRGLDRGVAGHASGTDRLPFFFPGRTSLLPLSRPSSAQVEGRLLFTLAEVTFLAFDLSVDGCPLLQMGQSLRRYRRQWL